MVSYLNVVNHFLDAPWNHRGVWYSCLLKATNSIKDYVQHYSFSINLSKQHNTMKREAEGHKGIPEDQLGCHLLLKLFLQNLILVDLLEENM